MRWRPPPEKSSPYVTVAGLRRLRSELKGLWPSRREVVAALSAAAAEGDRSENAEYIYRKKQLREMDRRIRYLQKRLDQLQPVTVAPGDRERIFFGARVQVEDQHGTVSCYRIVGPDEIGQAPEYISVDSPVARALLGRQRDEEVSVPVPEGERRLVVLAIDYPGDDTDDKPVS
ncbi:MAG: transcription elongation factor GreB [Wenzhouxiangella sp.]|jgi:transcription elongation factor GreB|nr:transcription elongation factor GreB [Wenzhouxiangella sp.]